MGITVFKTASPLQRDAQSYALEIASQISGERFAKRIQQESADVLASESTNLDEYFTAAFSDAMEHFYRAYAEADFESITYPDWIKRFFSEAKNPNILTTVRHG